jgi:predicted component of type VI protein secretion system
VSGFAVRGRFNKGEEKVAMPTSIELNVGHVPGRQPAARVTRENVGDEDAPFRVIVLGDFSGRAPGARGPLGDRTPVPVDIDTLDAVFAGLAPAATIAGLQDAAGAPLRIELASMDDLGADALVARLPRASAPAAAAAPAPAADDEDTAATLRRLLGGSIGANAPARAAAPTPAATSAPAAAIDRFIRELLASHATAPAPAADATAQAETQARTAALLRHVLRDPAWRRLECAWRSVDRFVRGLDAADAGVRLELFDCRADELLEDLARSGGEPARGTLARALRRDGRGCAVLASLEEFGAGVMEQTLLGGLAAVAQALDAVLVAAAGPALVGVATSEDPAVLATPEARVWRALRASPVAARVGLTFPRLLARLPYGPRTDPVAAFAFDELADGIAHDRLLWRSAALDAALLLACGETQGEGAGPLARLEDLPAFIDRSGAEPRLQAVAEAYLSDRDVAALGSAGFIALQSDRRVPAARIAAWQSIAADGAARESS